MNTIRRLGKSLNFISSIISSLLWPFPYAQLCHFSGMLMSFPMRVLWVPAQRRGQKGTAKERKHACKEN